MDVMVSLPDYQPKLLEMTFSPDCNRACKYHPTFYNDIFECLFFGKENDNIERVI
jgi:tubulin--tyrosine ligase-like protein 12